MENDVFEELLATDNTEVNNEEDQTSFDHSFDLTEDDLQPDEDSNDSEVNSEEVEDDEEGSGAQIENPTNTAFAQMRTQNKEFQNKLNELDTLAKSLGMKDADDFIAKAKDAQIKRDAATRGVPIEVARELEEMRALKDSIVAERQENAAREQEKIFVSNLQEFVNNNSLSKSAVDRLSRDLENDGFSIDALKAMPKTALNRVLSSYVDTKYQKSLERKNTIRKELPINQSSKVDTASLNKEIDALAKHLAGKL